VNASILASPAIPSKYETNTGSDENNPSGGQIVREIVVGSDSQMSWRRCQWCIAASNVFSDEDRFRGIEAWEKFAIIVEGCCADLLAIATNREVRFAWRNFVLFVWL
jgi:hypothetical protein